jgi:hypothetical protein
MLRSIGFMRSLEQMHPPGKRAGTLCAALLIVAITFAACSSANSASGSSTTPSSATTSGGSTSTSDFYPSGHIVPKPDTPTTVPREAVGQPVTPDIAAGQQIIITSNGFWPKTLYANFEVAITWTNLSGHPQKVSFDHIPVSSGLIPAGAQFVWKTHFGGSYTYSTASGFHALLILQAPTPTPTPTTSAP